MLWALPFEPRAGEEFYLDCKAIERELLVIENLNATAAQLGLDVEDMLAKAYSYVDRFGHYKAPFGVAVEVAKHCCGRFARNAPQEVVADYYYTFSASGSRRQSYARGGVATFTASLGDLRHQAKATPQKPE